MSASPSELRPNEPFPPFGSLLGSGLNRTGMAIAQLWSSQGNAGGSQTGSGNDAGTQGANPQEFCAEKAASAEKAQAMAAVAARLCHTHEKLGISAELP
jgi:hypothetical protein